MQSSSPFEEVDEREKRKKEKKVVSSLPLIPFKKEEECAKRTKNRLGLGPRVRYNKHGTKLIIIFSLEYREKNRIDEGLTRAPANKVKNRVKGEKGKRNLHFAVLISVART